MVVKPQNLLLTKQAGSNTLGSMYHYHGLMKYPVVVLILLYALAGGHTLCAYWHCPHPTPHCDHPCGDSHHQEEEPCCCPDEPCSRKHHCDGNDQPTIVVRRDVDDTTNPLTVPFLDCVAFVGIELPPVGIVLHDAVAVCSSALPVRLHLLYRSLLI